MLPRNLKPGRSYSNAVDLWALGVVVHEILTSEIPFLDSDTDTTMTITGELCTSDDTPEVDMELLFKYCRDPALFPTQPFHTNGISDIWQDFVRSLMAVDPRDRPSATDALNSRCLTEHDLELLRNQLGLLLSVELRSAAITILLESELGVFVAILHSFGGITIHELHSKATDMGFLEVIWLVGMTGYEAYFGGDLSMLKLPSWYGQIDMMKVMLDCEAFDGQNEVPRSQTVLRKAAADGYLDLVKLLIAQGASVNVKYRKSGDLTALQSAAQNGHVDVVKLLIAQGADLNAASGWHGSVRALQLAAENGHVDVLQLLMAHGVHPDNASGMFGSLAPLQAAAEEGQVDAITVLLFHGANVDAMYERRAALHVAAKNGQVDAIRVLLAHGADVNANYRGWTALYDAAENGHVDAIKVLLAHGANFEEEDKGWPALKTAVVYGQVDAIRVLLAHGAEVRGEDGGGTALRGAVGSGHDPTNVNLARPSSRFATQGGYMRRVAGMTDVHNRRKNWTPLQLAATNRYPDAVAVLLAHGLGMVSQTGAGMASG